MKSFTVKVNRANRGDLIAKSPRWAAGHRQDHRSCQKVSGKGSDLNDVIETLAPARNKCFRTPPDPE
jgi:hypothetical protein